MFRRLIGDILYLKRVSFPPLAKARLRDIAFRRWCVAPEEDPFRRPSRLEGLNQLRARSWLMIGNGVHEM